MQRKTIANIVTGGVLLAFGFASYVLLKPFIYRATSSPPPPDVLRLSGTIHDFNASHPDFNVMPAGGYGHYAGNVAGLLDEGERPVFTGPGETADPTPEPPGAFGYETAFNPQEEHTKKYQTATRVILPVDAELLSITAYIGMKDKDVAYAIYSDVGGEPGTLIAETSPEESSKHDMQWLTLGVPKTPLLSGAYWLALSVEDDDHEYAYQPTGGATRTVENEAAKDGFLEGWGTSEVSNTRRISIYATISTADQKVKATGGYKVLDQWTDAQARPIAPHMYGAGEGGDGPIDFEIVDQGVIPQEPYAVKVTVLGAAIQAGSDGYHRPVTTKIHVGSDVYEPFGSYEDAVTGNLNDIQTITGNANVGNPRSEVLTQVFSPTTPIWVTGRSWKLVNSSAPSTNPVNWEPKMTATTIDNGIQVMVLRNGDPVPDIQGLYQQDSIADYVAGYVNTSTGTMTLGINEIIYLFEVGENGDSSTADFQDLVVLVTLASDPTDFPGGPELCGQPLGDTTGTAGDPGSGGISSPDSFGQWYRDVMGTNLSRRHTINLVRNAFGVYEYLDDAFHPIDDRVLGNEGKDHNHHFTYAIDATFRYERCAGQFFEFEGTDDAWLFVDRKLVLDLGGVIPGSEQHVSMDRLGLVDGEVYDVRFFHAQRQENQAVFRMRTNMNLSTAGVPNVISGSYD